MEGKKRAKQFFQTHTNSGEKNVGKKNQREKVRNNVFYIHTNIVTINCGEKNAWNNFSIHTSVKKKVGKKIVGKMRNVFLYSHEYRDQKLGGKERPKQFCQKHTNSVRKNVGKKIVRKKCETSFFKFTRIAWPKMGGKKRAKQFFQTHTNCAKKNVGKKNQRETVRNNVF